MESVLVTGGTGTLGRHVVRRLTDAGRDLRVLTRQTRPAEHGVRYVTADLLSGADLGPAVEGVETIIHCAGSNKDDDVATKHLVDAALREGRPHLVFISVVGAERMPVESAVDRTMFGYFAMKRRAERVVEASGLPWTTLRATQFHDLILFVLDKLTKLPVVPVPSSVAFQPVDTDEVAERMVQLAFSRPAGLVPDLAGPRVHATRDLVRSYVEATHRRRLLVPVRLPGKAARALRAGANLPKDGDVGTRTWEEFLPDHLSPPVLVH
jgi:uncharacterized protein YbjT (DUF2867 family)